MVLKTFVGINLENSSAGKMTVLKHTGHWLLTEAQQALSKDVDLVVMCGENGQMSTSRLLLGLLLRPEIRNELYSDPDSCLVLEDVSLEDVKDLLKHAFYSQGTVTSESMKKFPFVDWSIFRGRPQADAKSTPSTAVECPICGKALSDKKSLKKHADVVHFNIRNHNCELCGKRFIARNDLTDHVRAVHDKVKAFICDCCGQTLSTRHGLRMHKLIHKDETKSIACSRCDKTFRHLSTYRKHIARIHDFNPDKRLQCESCQRLFNHTEGLKRHVKKFHAVSKPSFQCPFCPLAFVFNYDLNKHTKRVHTS